MIKRARPLSALRRSLLVAAALLTIPVTGLYAQTTGRLFGQLADAQGAALPGVTVTVSSPPCKAPRRKSRTAKATSVFRACHPAATR